MVGEIVRTGPLSWAQVSMWHLLFWHRRGEWFPLRSHAWPVDGDVPLETVRGAWETIVRRHEILRSSFRLSSAGRPVQRVLSPEEFDTPISYAPMTEFAAFETAAHRLDFDGPLWSVTIFHENGIARASCILVEHVLFDAFGLQNWRKQINELIVDPHRQVDVAHPIDLAEAEPSVDHPRVRRARERYKESLARSAQVLIPATRQAGADRYRRSTATFFGLAEAVDVIARRCQGTPPAVLAYVVGWLIARLARHQSLALGVVYGNRAMGDQSIGCHMEHVYFSVDFGTASPTAGIQGLAQATFVAFARGRMPRYVAEEVRSSVSAERGVDIKGPVVINVMNGPDALLGVNRGAESNKIVDEWNSAGRPFCNTVEVVISGDAIEVSLDVDGAMFTRADTAAILEDFPKAVRCIRDSPDRALDDYADWSTTPFPLDDGLVRVGQDWVRPRKVEKLIAAVPGVRAVEVDVEGDELVADVPCDDDSVYFDIHEHLSAASSDHGDVVAPARYRRGSADAWYVRERQVVPPASDAELALRDAIRRTHGFTVEDFGHTYVTAGCELDLVPAVVVELERRGYVGLRSAMFSAPSTLRMVARASSTAPTTG